MTAADNAASFTLVQLDAVHRQANWLIAKRSGGSALKSLVMGNEPLAETIAAIADLYRLSDEQRATLEPSMGSDLTGGIADVVNVARTAVGLNHDSNAPNKLASAVEHNANVKSVVALAALAPAARAHPVVAAASVAFAVGSAGWFAYQARAFNQAAYALVKATIIAPEDSGDPDGTDEADAEKGSTKPLFGKLKNLASKASFTKASET